MTALQAVLAVGSYFLVALTGMGVKNLVDGEAVSVAQHLLFIAAMVLVILALLPALLNRWWLWALVTALAGFCVAMALAIVQPYVGADDRLPVVFPFIGSAGLLLAALLDWWGRPRSALGAVGLSSLTIPMFFVVKNATESEHAARLL